MNTNLAYQDPVWEECINGTIVAMSPRPSISHSYVAGNIYSIFWSYLKRKKMYAIC